MGAAHPAKGQPAVWNFDPLPFECLQVALLVIMAQAGSFVPASFMALRTFEALYTRMGTGDSIETNSSSFMLEMQVGGEG